MESGDLDARPCAALSEGHALQRLGYGVDIGVLTVEYGLLRRVLLRQLLEPSGGPDLRPALVQLNHGIDQAVQEAVSQHVSGRDEVRERFLGVLAHDLRSPLATIVTAASAVQFAGERADLPRALEVIVRTGNRMARLIDDILAFAQTRIGPGVPVRLEPGDLGAICRAAVDEFRHAHPGRNIGCETSGDLFGMWDADRVVQVVTNLLANAVAHGTDPVELRLREMEDRRALVMEVTNQGEPIPPDVLPRVFDPFVRSTARSRGVGLGLHIVHQIATAHGATCAVQSTAEAGTTFTLRWPRTPLEETPHRA